MKKYLVVTLSILLNLQAQTQNNNPRIELHVAPGLFLEKLNYDSLVPPKRRGVTRLGDVVSFAAQYSIPLHNGRGWFKIGIGYSERHYSLNKTGVNDVLIALLSFDSPPRLDSFAITKVRLTNKYFQVPLSLGTILTHDAATKRFRFIIGLNLRSEFLVSSNAEIIVDPQFGSNAPAGIAELQRQYTKDASKWVVVLTPFIEHAFYLYKDLGMFWQLEPFSLFASKLNSKFTSSTIELFSFKFGLYYNIRPGK
jgi:hypothetical protein